MSRSTTQLEQARPIDFTHVWLIAGAAALGGLMFGFDIAIITGAGPFIQAHFALDELALGWAFSSLLFGCVVGAAVAGVLADRFGRRRTMIGVAMLFGATTILTGVADRFDLFVAARLLGGVAVGIVSLVAPMYVAEVAPASLRGRMGALYQMAIVTGILLSYLINYALRDAGPDAWRYMFYTGVAPAVVFVVLMLLAPESPRFLVRQGRDADAAAVLQRIGGGDAVRDVADIRASLVPGPALAALQRPALRRPLTISVWLAT